MRPSILISPALWISVSLVTFVGCQNRAPSLRMLDARSGYSAGLDDEEVALYQKGHQNSKSLARKSAPRVARVYIYPHELPSKDYFWGGYVSLVVSPDEWIFEDPNLEKTQSRKKAQGVKE
jgi:hypothetical protein